MALESVNPVNDSLIRRYSGHTAQEIEARLRQTSLCFAGWRQAGFDTRAGAMRQLAGLLRDREEELASLITTEMGKPVTASRAEISKCAWVCDYYAEHAQAFLADEAIASDAANSFVSFQPLGPVLAIMPWNFPFWQVFRFAAPTLMAGNVGLLKHASNVSGCALAIEALFHEAGFPDGAFASLLIESDAVAGLIEDERIAAVTLTGSEAAGRAVAAKAGASLKKSVLELGGSDAYVVLADADVEAAAASCVASRLINTGQSCIAAKRFIVVEALHDEFVAHCQRLLQQSRQGDPMDAKTELGPLARRDLRNALHEQVRSSIAAGARCLLGGSIPDRPGAWYPATLLTELQPGMPAWEEELFGPVAAVIRAGDTEDALRIANNSSYGLGAAIFTADVPLGERLAATRLDAGAVAVNDFVKSDPRLPFGGIKHSGYGRELSAYGIREFVNIKTVTRS